MAQASLQIPFQLPLYFPLHSQLEPQQIRNHLPTRDPRSSPQRREIQRAAKPICKPKEQHRRDPSSSILHRETSLVHLILLDGAALEMVNTALGVDFWLVGAGSVGELGADEDVEVVVGGVAACVAFCANGGAWAVSGRIS